jgi:hypothetical protein
MRLHNPQITGSLTLSGSSNVDFTSATGGVSGSFRASDIKSALPANTVSSSLTFYEDDDLLPSYISNYFAQNPSGSIPYILNEDSCLWELSGSGS